MKAVLLIFDSLNRKFLPNYGCDWTVMPNFGELANRALTFDSHYGGSMPCIPARREMHTGRYNFLHRSWGPMEPFDESVISALKKAGVYTHISTDHFHYWEDGGSCYLSKYDSCEMVRGQEGDLWMGQVEEPEYPPTLSRRAVNPLTKNSWRHDWINRAFIDSEEKMPQARTFAGGLDFIDRNRGADNWFLQIETFDPHEPFFTQPSYKELYKENYTGKNYDWPEYGYNSQSAEATAHVRYEYAALLSMCDRYLGEVLRKFDEYGLWKDTMLIVTTDHGFLLGEHRLMGKNMMPWYEELIHIPLFVYDPRRPEQKGQRRSSLTQTVDIAPTLAEYFGAAPLEHADGRSLAPVIAGDEKIRQTALFGGFGSHINITDGRYVYMRAPVSPDNKPLYEYTLMPCHMRKPFSPGELSDVQLASFGFTKGARVMKVPISNPLNSYWLGNRLYDLENDPEQNTPVRDRDAELRLIKAMRDMMLANGAPDEQYERVGIPKEGEVSWGTVSEHDCSEDDYIGVSRLRFTAKGRKALNIFLSLQDPEKQRRTLAGMQAALPADREIGEETVLALIKKFLPAGYGEIAENMLRMFLL